MERMLKKLANQLNQYDENSLMDLWHTYANKVARFEPSSRWQEDALIFCMIQSMHWKNQLFNAELAASVRRGKGMEDKMLQHELAALSKQLAPPKEGKAKSADAKNSASVKPGKKACKLLMFRPGDLSQPG